MHMWYTVMNYHVSSFDLRKLYDHFEELKLFNWTESVAVTCT